MRTRALAVPDFAGVALADILANGVAMLIIVIVLTLNARYEQEQGQLEQVDEVSVMLSRQLATSIVMNRLSASPPARLHDYRNSPLDRVRDPKILPIVEFHRDFVRDLYSGRIYAREELLLEKNALDNFLAGFSRGQRQRLRVDIYEVRLFYIAMSILKAHGISPRHWHFLEGGGMGFGDAGLCPGGTAGGDCRGLGSALAEAEARRSLDEMLAQSGGAEEGAAGQQAAEQDAGGKGMESREGKNSAATAAGEGSGSGAGSASSEQGYGQGEAGTLPPAGVELGWGGPGTGPSDQYRDEDIQGGSAGQGESGEGGLFEQLMQSMTQSPLAAAGARPGNSGKINFRWSAPESVKQSRSSPRADRPGSSVPISQVLDYRGVLTGLLDYMRQVQSVLDAGRSPRQLVVDIGGKISKLLKNAPPPHPEDVPLIESLVWHFRGYWHTDEMLHLRRLQEDLPGSSVLTVPVNAGLDTVVLETDGSASPRSYGPPVPARVRVNFSEYPGIYRGLSKELEQDAVLLMPPDADAPEEFRWRVLTYVGPSLNDFVLAFVYAAFDQDGHLLLDVQANQVKVDGGALRGQSQEKLFGWRGWLVVLYTLLVAALASFLLALLRRRRRQSPGAAEGVA